MNTKQSANFYHKQNSTYCEQLLLSREETSPKPFSKKTFILNLFGYLNEKLAETNLTLNDGWTVAYRSFKERECVVKLIKSKHTLNLTLHW